MDAHVVHPFHLPAGVVAAIGARLCARDRAALAVVCRTFAASCHHAVTEEDAWPSPRPLASDSRTATAEEAAASRARVAALVRAMPALRTLRVGLGQHEEARAFLELGGGRAARFACFPLCWRCPSRAADLAIAFPGRVGAEILYLSPLICCPADAGPPDDIVERRAAVVRALGPVDVVDVAPYRPFSKAELDRSARDRIDANARRLVASLPWPGVRAARFAFGDRPDSAEETAALLELAPPHVALGLRVQSYDLVKGLPALLEAVRARGPAAARALERVERLHVDCQQPFTLGPSRAVFDMCQAMPDVARLPPRCAISVSATLCSHPHLVPLLRHAADAAEGAGGGRRARVELVCGGGAGEDSLTAFARREAAPPDVRAFVRAVVACLPVRVAGCRPIAVAVDAHGRDLDEQPDGDAAAALAGLRADPRAAGTAALWQPFFSGAREGGGP